MAYLLAAKRSEDNTESGQTSQQDSVSFMRPIATFEKQVFAEIVRDRFSDDTELELVVTPIEHEPSFSALVEQLNDGICCLYW